MKIFIIADILGTNGFIYELQESSSIIREKRRESCLP